MRDLDDFSASLRGLASQNGANVATVNLTAQKIKGLVGSVAAAVQVKPPSTLIPSKLHDYDCRADAKFPEPACTGALPSDRQRRADF